MRSNHGLPRELAATIRTVFCNNSEDWLNNLPYLVGRLELAWGIQVGSLFPDLSYNAVYHATLANGTPAVLKIGPPNPEFSSEIAALRVFNGRGAVRILRADPSAAALLLERVTPGDSLHAVVDDAEATRIAAHAMRDLHALTEPTPYRTQGVPGPGRGLDPSTGDLKVFPNLEVWCRALGNLRTRSGGETCPIPSKTLDEAESLLEELLATASARVLLHGDFHHGNLLRSEDGWTAIDPKGVIGDPAFEVGTFLRNHFAHDANPRRVTARRLDIFADVLSLPRRRLKDWAYVEAVLSACWSIEDGDAHWAGALNLAEMIKES